MKVTFQHGNTTSLRYPAEIVDRVDDVADLLVDTPYGPVTQFGVPVVAGWQAAGANTCYVEPE